MLNEWLALCCETYNAALQERRDAYRLAGISIGYSQQSGWTWLSPPFSADVKQARNQAIRGIALAFAMIR